MGGQKEVEEEDKAIMVMETLAVEVDLYFESKTAKYGQVFHMWNKSVGFVHLVNPKSHQNMVMEDLATTSDHLLIPNPLVQAVEEQSVETNT